MVKHGETKVPHEKSGGQETLPRCTLPRSFPDNKIAFGRCCPSGSASGPAAVPPPPPPPDPLLRAPTLHHHDSGCGFVHASWVQSRPCLAAISAPKSISAGWRVGSLGPLSTESTLPTIELWWEI